MVLYPKDERITKLLERLTIEKATYTNSDIVKQLGRYSEIRRLRKNGGMYIGKDRHKDVSIIFCKKLLKRKRGGFVF